MNAAACQYADKCGETLPLTGFIVWTLIVLGLVAIVAGFIARGRR